jgi:hypothetical protein
MTSHLRTEAAARRIILACLYQDFGGARDIVGEVCASCMPELTWLLGALAASLLRMHNGDKKARLAGGEAA